MIRPAHMRSIMRGAITSTATMPAGAVANGLDLSASVWGAWSDPSDAMVPSSTPCQSASRSASSRTGGNAFMAASRPSQSAATNSR